MKLTIETFQRDNGVFVAVATEEGKLTEEGGLAAHNDESKAVHRALENLFKTRKAPEEPNGWNRPTRRYHAAYQIERAILQAADEPFKPTISMGYRDLTGAYTERQVYVLDTRRAFSGALLITARDLKDDQVKTFRADGVQWIEGPV